MTRCDVSGCLVSRRSLLGAMATGATALALGPQRLWAAAAPATKPIPSSGERIPVVGLGSWSTFNVGTDVELRNECTAVIAAFLAAGGRMIDSSPMYGSSQETIGYALDKLGHPASVFSADKVWISSGAKGPGQIEESRQHWGVKQFDLLQVHNLLAWEEQLPILFEMKKQGKLRYVGITTSEGRRHEDIEQVMRSQPIDFVQVTYNIQSRQVEQRILPLAADRGIAVICNRPFEKGALLREVEQHPLPPMAADIGARTWAQFILKYIVSQPAVTCAIPATSKVAHAQENLQAASGTMPDAAFRNRMAGAVASL
jgi:diketogulonate reductase-like aldo/keto reductase